MVPVHLRKKNASDLCHLVKKGLKFCDSNIIPECSFSFRLAYIIHDTMDEKNEESK